MAQVLGSKRKGGVYVLSLIINLFMMVILCCLIGGFSPLKRRKFHGWTMKISAALAAMYMAVVLWRDCYFGILQFFLRFSPDGESGAYAEFLAVFSIIIAGVCFYRIFLWCARKTLTVVLRREMMAEIAQHGEHSYYCLSYEYDGQTYLQAVDIAKIVRNDQRKRHHRRIAEEARAEIMAEVAARLAEQSAEAMAGLSGETTEAKAALAAEAVAEN